MENVNAPDCVGCGQSEHMVLETSTPAMEHWHCSYCGTKTRKATVFGKVRPLLGLVTLVLFGIKIS